MRKINEQELDNIIRDVINEQIQMYEATDEGIWGGVKGAAKQVGSDIKNAWHNMKQAYKYGSKEQDIKKQYPSNNTAQPTSSTPQGNSNNVARVNGGGNQKAQPAQGQKKATNSQQSTNKNQQQQPVQQQPQMSKQAQARIDPMRVSTGNRMIKQTVMQLISTYGLNFEQVYYALRNAADDVKKHKNKYFPQTNESILSDSEMERLTEEIVTRIKKG